MTKKGPKYNRIQIGLIQHNNIMRPNLYVLWLLQVSRTLVPSKTFSKHVWINFGWNLSKESNYELKKLHNVHRCSNFSCMYFVILLQLTVQESLSVLLKNKTLYVFAILTIIYFYFVKSGSCFTRFSLVDLQSISAIICFLYSRDFDWWLIMVDAFLFVSNTLVIIKFYNTLFVKVS